MSTEVTHAGFWPRFWAMIVDSVWLSGILLGILWYLFGPTDDASEGGTTALYVTIQWVVPLLVVMAFWITKSATPGKMLFKMKIVDAETHERVSPGRLFIRYLFYFVSTLPLFLGFLWAVWDKKKQGWHDKVAGTVVVRGL